MKKHSFLFNSKCSLTRALNIINQTEVIVPSDSFRAITFEWNTSGFAKGEYSIRAVAVIVEGETDLTEQMQAFASMRVAMVGDITGPKGYPDGKCDIRDIAMVAILFGVNYPDPRYDPNYDLTGPIVGVADGKIDIRDIALIASHYGDIDP